VQKIYNVAVCGEVGQGKSTFVNSFLNGSFSKTGDELSGVTKTIEKFFGKFLPLGLDVKMYDMPGFGDQDITSKQLIKMWEKELKGEKFDCICFVFRIDSNRITSFTTMMLQVVDYLIEGGDNKWDNVILVFTHCDKVEDAESRANTFKEFLNSKLNSNITKYILYRKDKPSESINIFGDSLKFMKGVIKLIEIIDQSEIKKIICKWIGENCYDPKSLVIRKSIEGNVEYTFLKNLAIGDMIKINNGDFQKVIAISTYQNSSKIILSIFAQSILDDNIKKEIKLTEQHFMYVSRGDKELHIPARKVRVGDKLISQNGTIFTIIEIKDIGNDEDLMNVRTPSRTLIINDIKCSCVSEDDAGYLGHLMLLVADKIHAKLPQIVNQLGIKIRNSYTNKIIKNN